MAVIKQGGTNPYAGKVMTTRGPRDPELRLCYGCGKKQPDGLFTLRDDGKVVGPCCAGGRASVLETVTHRTACEDGACGCVNREPEDGKLDDATLPDD